MDDQEVVRAIEEKHRFDSETGVEVSSKMLQILNYPQAGMPWIHIAGTNGKGSVSAFLCQILREAGLRVGMFTSPHLVDFRERIRVNGEMIAREAVAEIGTKLLNQDFKTSPTMFDYCMIMAVLYFREQKCDVAVIETGLGGRLDSTNALGVPEVTVITRIGYDHMNILGHTLEEIAAEKAGIIKHGTSLILAPQEHSVTSVLKEAAERQQVIFRQAEQTELKREGFDGERQFFSYGNYEHLSMGLLGMHQYENAAAAILAAEEFLTKKASLLQDNQKERQAYYIKQGIAKTTWAGRMQIIRREPFLLVDGAHNSNGAAALKEGLTYLFPGEKFHFLMGVMADKDYEKMVEILAPLALDFGTVTVENGRAMQAGQLAECIKKKGMHAVCHASLQDALAWAGRQEKEKSIAFGSLYFIGAIEEVFMSKNAVK